MNKVSENPFKNRTEHLSPYVIVSVLFVLCYVVSNLMAVKVVGFFDLFYFDAGTITFPLAYMLGDVLTEIWGFKTAKKTIILAFLCNIFVVLCTQIGVWLPFGRTLKRLDHGKDQEEDERTTPMGTHNRQFYRRLYF